MLGLHGTHVRLQSEDEMHDTAFPQQGYKAVRTSYLSLSGVFCPLKDDGIKVRGLFQT